MPTVSFPVRLVFDYDFYQITIKEYTKTHSDDNPSILAKLMYINAKSCEYRRQFNMMSKRVFDEILKNNPSMPRDLLRSSFYYMEEPEIEKIDDETERTIKCSIELVSDPPHRSLILTTPEKEKEYLENRHFIEARDINVKSGSEALGIINRFWELCSQR